MMCEPTECRSVATGFAWSWLAKHSTVLESFRELQQQCRRIVADEHLEVLDAVAREHRCRVAQVVAR